METYFTVEIIKHIFKTSALWKQIPKRYGQYTGIKDKNGKEIYEGDIVELKVSNGCCEMTGIIIYDEYDLAFELKDIDNQTQECLWYQEQELEVIGNIYDNSELLKEE